VPALGEEDVSRLDIAMDNVSRVSGVERVCDIDRNREKNFRPRGRPAMRCFSVSPSRNSITMKA